MLERVDEKADHKVLLVITRGVLMIAGSTSLFFVLQNISIDEESGLILTEITVNVCQAVEL